MKDLYEDDGADVVLHAPLDLDQVLAAVLHATIRRDAYPQRGWTTWR